MHQLFLSLCYAGLAFCGWMMIRVCVAGHLSFPAIEQVYDYNVAMIKADRYASMLDYDKAIRSLEDIMWDFSAWTPPKAFSSPSVYEQITKGV